MLIRMLLGKYDLLDHVNTVTAVNARTPDWTREDYIIRSWLYGSISDEILNIIMAEDQTTQEPWSLITNLLLDNQMTRIVYPEAEFRAIVQGNLSITAYCHRLKALFDALRDVGTPISDQALVPNCLRGLNPRYANITTIAMMQNPLPSFDQTCSLITRREIQLGNSINMGDHTALYSNDNGGARGQDRGENRSSYGNYGGGNIGGNRNCGGNYYRKKKTDGGGNNSSGGGNNSGGPPARNAGGHRAALPAPAPPAPGPWAYFSRSRHGPSLGLACSAPA
jgi:hypothetical protein